MTRVSAEFESPELAELALKRVKETIDGVFSTSIIYDRTSDKALKLRSGTLCTIIPTAVTTHNYFTAVMESPAAEDVIAEPYRRRSASVYAVCDESAVKGVRSVFNSMGGLKIRTPRQS